MICAGIDAGSRATKIVIFDSDSNEIIAQGLADQGVEQDEIANRLFDSLLDEKDIKKPGVQKIVATGYGRDIISIADTTVTEITCQAVGVKFFSPDARTIIDIGGQDSKVVRLDDKGRVRDFVMNDRCAAGTGRFLEIVAERLGLDVELLGDIAVKSKAPAVISSMCVVFAESEIIGLLASGKAKEDIVAGVQRAIASRIASMVGRTLDLPVIFTGGVALVSGMSRVLSDVIQQRVTVSLQPQMTAALGAAIIAANERNGSV